MKCTLLTIALVAAAGTAGAQTVSTPAGSVNAGAGAATGGSATTTTPPASAGTTMNSGATMNGNAGMRGAQMGTSTQMNGNTGAGGSAGADIANAPAQPLTGAAGTAQKRIEQDGYKNVQNLQKGADGLWHGTAMRGNTQVQVTVDRAGRVAVQ